MADSSVFNGWRVRAGSIVVKFNEPEEVTAGGIYIPDKVKQPKDYAEVLAVGEGYYDANGNYKAPPVVPGDTIRSNPMWGRVFYGDPDEDGQREKYWILQFTDVVLTKVHGKE